MIFYSVFSQYFHENGMSMKLDVAQTIQVLSLKCKGWFQ